MRFREDIVRGVRLAGFAFAGLLVALAIHRTINFSGTADAQQPAVNAPEPDPNAYLSMPAPVVPAPPVTEPEPAPVPVRAPAHPVAQKEQAVPPPPPPAPKRKESSEVAAKYVPPPRTVTPQTESLNAPAFIDPAIPHISAESIAAGQDQVQAPAPPPGKLSPEDAANAKLPPITPVFVVPPESQNKGHGMGWIKAVGRALKPKKDD